MEGAQNPQVGAETLDYLSRLGTELEPDAPAVLSSMVRRSVALNPNASEETVRRLSEDARDARAGVRGVRGFLPCALP